jgi:hypothetical protein
VVFSSAIVVTERLLIEVTQQVKRFNRNIRAMKSAFHQRPEVFESVCVNAITHVLNSMVNYFVLEALITLCQPL